jgi:RNA recognition motif-containing protein
MALTPPQPRGALHNAFWESRGFAFVELAPEADLAAAIKELNGKVIDGRALTVNEVRPQKKREFRDRDSSRRPGDRDHPMRDRGPALY